MTVALFFKLILLFSVVSSLFMQAIKKNFIVKYPTFVVLGLSAIIGWIGGGIACYFLGIPFTVGTILSILLMAPTCFLTATLGYDKVMDGIKEVLITGRV